ncbi:MAG: type III-B CRISPR module RAMP protein Cmr4 [Chloroflexi bacterium AL-W]|nr:type III-B CRISPR module RAMP protein Cmr4 [Chloroflexi bacterium AL-N1]NOK66640.1 type III-B CRISPR module RAMP protein Cmr4 [Chloroflexi bacterium AL-N10]NOK72028.1 type III-B CRISPR module RAMP protein Cmr4 [Chloroflexi bacterium AL-N5]NOK81285.1 type III-B CRISPR module RAMP protein Cmr4 [Chloroflexi bacterium AL-W]NOK89558.1 type III-B CRISPR module RAMP protein Cmr4 [Chloroflexi bacterium AL-N15]
MTTHITFVHALSPLHAGTGQGVGVIDLPIAREKATNLPYLPGSSIKGALRAGCSDEESRRTIYGADARELEALESSTQFSDQRLLLLPIRSLAGTFAWVTSPYILQRFKRDLRDASIDCPAMIFDNEIASLNTSECLVSSSESVIVIEGDNKVYLEDLDLVSKTTSEEVDAWAKWIAARVFPGDDTTWQDMLKKRFCVVHDDVLGFLLNTATEIIARIKLGEETKTVDAKQGALWYEEALPTETILTGMVRVVPNKKARENGNGDHILTTLQTEKPLQLGGNVTVGRGMCRVRISESKGG